MVKRAPYCTEEVGSLSAQGTNIQHAVEGLRPCAAINEPVNHNKRAHVPQQNIPHDAMKTSHIAAKT